MKRSLAAIVCAVVVVGLAATPAVAQRSADAPRSAGPVLPRKMTLAKPVAAQGKAGATTITPADRAAARKLLRAQAGRSLAEQLTAGASLSPGAKIAYRQSAVRAASNAAATGAAGAAIKAGPSMATVRPYRIEGAELRGATLTKGVYCYEAATIDVAFTIRNTATASPIAAPRLTIEHDGQLMMKVLPILPPNGVVTVEMTDVPLAPGKCESASPPFSRSFSAWPVIAGAVVDLTALEVVATFPTDGAPTLSLVNHPVTFPSEPEPQPSACPAGQAQIWCWETYQSCYFAYGCSPPREIPVSYCVASGESCPP